MAWQIAWTGTGKAFGYLGIVTDGERFYARTDVPLIEGVKRETWHLTATDLASACDEVVNGDAGLFHAMSSHKTGGE